MITINPQGRGDRPQRGTCGVCKQDVAGAVLDGMWYPMRCSEHASDCPAFQETLGTVRIEPRQGVLPSDVFAALVQTDDDLLKELELRCESRAELREQVYHRMMAKYPRLRERARDIARLLKS